MFSTLSFKRGYLRADLAGEEPLSRVHPLVLSELLLAGVHSVTLATRLQDG